MSGSVWLQIASEKSIYGLSLSAWPTLIVEGLNANAVHCQAPFGSPIRSQLSGFMIVSEALKALHIP